MGSRHAVELFNGTTALYLAVKLCGKNYMASLTGHGVLGKKYWQYDRDKPRNPFILQRF